MPNNKCSAKKTNAASSGTRRITMSTTTKSLNYGVPTLTVKRVSFMQLAKKDAQAKAYLPHPEELLATAIKNTLNGRENKLEGVLHSFPSAIEGNEFVATAIKKLEGLYGVEVINDNTIRITPPNGILAEDAVKKTVKK